MKIYRESITEYKIHELLIRCWRQEENLNTETIVNTRYEINSVITHLDHLELKDIAEVLLGMERMNAVEVKKKKNMCGCVVYKDWP